jgi:hypothetical protein
LRPPISFLFVCVWWADRTTEPISFWAGPGSWTLPPTAFCVGHRAPPMRCGGTLQSMQGRPFAMGGPLAQFLRAWSGREFAPPTRGVGARWRAAHTGAPRERRYLQVGACCCCLSDCSDHAVPPLRCVYFNIDTHADPEPRITLT